MKKVIALLLALTLLCALCACNSTATEATVEPKPAETETTLVTASTEPEATGPVLIFSPFTVVDNDACKIDILNVDPTHETGCLVTVNIENKSDEAIYNFDLEYAAINGMQCDFLVNNLISETEINAGESQNVKITLLTDAVVFAGVERIADVEFGLYAYVIDSGVGKNRILSEIVHIYPYGQENTEVFMADADAEDVVFENDDVKIAVIGYGTDKRQEYGFGVYLCITNKTNEQLRLTWEGVSLNGMERQYFKFLQLQPQRTTYTLAGWGYYEVEALGIQKIDDVTEAVFSVNIMNMANFSTVADEMITVHP